MRALFPSLQKKPPVIFLHVPHCISTSTQGRLPAYLRGDPTTRSKASSSPPSQWPQDTPTPDGTHSSTSASSKRSVSNGGWKAPRAPWRIQWLWCEFMKSNGILVRHGLLCLIHMCPGTTDQLQATTYLAKLAPFWKKQLDESCHLVCS